MSLEKDYRPGTEDLHKALDFFELSGDQPGIHTLVIGGVHGDELTPFSLLNSLRDSQISHGKLTVIPFLNNSGLRQRQHEHPALGLDLNRVFHRDDLPELDKIRSMIREADLVVDLHTHQHTQTVPYGVIMLTDDSQQNEHANSYLRKLGLGFVEKVDLQQLGDRAQGTLVKFALNQGKAALIVEMSNLSTIKQNDYLRLKDHLLHLNNPDYPPPSLGLREVRKYAASSDIVVDFLTVQLGFKVMTGDLLFTGRDPETHQSTLVAAEEKGEVVTLPTQTLMKKSFALYRLA